MSKLKVERELLVKPGDTILETIDHLKMSQAELSERMGRTPSKVNDIISGKEPITMATALQLEKVLGIDAPFWLNLELNYREKLSRIEQAEVLEECKDWLLTQPIKELKEYGYIKSDKSSAALVDELLKFYSVASPVQWESLYIDEYVTANFRKSKVHKSTLGALGAWLRIGEIELKKFNITAFDKNVFKENLVEIKKLVRQHPEDFATRLQKYCFDAGVALIYSIGIPKAPVSGVARWIGGTPLIQLTDRYKSNDHFWFTFFHEAGHIMLHGKKNVFIEDFDNAINDTEKENEANEFANDYLLAKNILEDLPEKITENDIKILARKYNTHPAIILGYLQKKEIVSYAFGSSLRIKVILDDVISNKL